MTGENLDFDRRAFAARLAAGAVTAPWAAAAALAAREAAGNQQARTPPKPTDKPAPGADEPDEKPRRFDPIARQLELLVQKYPSDELTVEGLRLIAEKLAGQRASSERLQEVALDNSDGPGFVFAAYRRPDKP